MIALAILLIAAASAAAAALIGPWRTDEPAGQPATGRFELKQEVAGVTYALLVWQPTESTRYVSAGNLCFESGPEKTFSKYPVNEGGSCFDPDVTFSRVPMVASRGGGNGVVLIDGVARQDVRSVSVSGPDGTDPAPLSRSGGFMRVYEARDPAASYTVTATLDDGQTYRQVFEPPPAVAAPRLPHVSVTRTTPPASGGTALVRPRAGSASTTFALVLRVPGKRDPSLTYEFTLAGPGGPSCADDLKAHFGVAIGEFESGYVERPLAPQRQSELLRSDDRGFSPDAASGRSWCPGTFRLTGRLSGVSGVVERLEPLTFEVRQ